MENINNLHCRSYYIAALPPMWIEVLMVQSIVQIE